MYTHMHAIIINEKSGHEFEEELGWGNRRVWRGEREGRNVIKSQPQK